MARNISFKTNIIYESRIRIQKYSILNSLRHLLTILKFDKILIEKIKKILDINTRSISEKNA